MKNKLSTTKKIIINIITEKYILIYFSIPNIV